MTPELASEQAQAKQRARLIGGPVAAPEDLLHGQTPERRWEDIAGRLSLAEGALAAVEGQLEEVKAHLQEVIEAFDRRKLSATGDRDVMAARWLDLLERESPHARVRGGAPAGLSEREVEVLRLIAAGKSNQEIAEALVISRHTVIRHVSHIFAKSGAANRAEAAAYATRRGLA